jgi:MarR family 2-MHQ and catechol resistance regulon transcriptional repressor
MSKTHSNENDTTGPKLWVVLARAYGSLAHYVEQCIVAEGLCLSDFMMLEVLLHKGPLSISVIGEKVLLTNASMTAAVDRLEKRGFVLRHNSEEDRRSKIVTLTAEGREFISELYARHVLDIEAVTSSLSQKEQNKMRSLLKTLGLAAQKETERRREAVVAMAAPMKERARAKKA